MRTPHMLSRNKSNAGHPDLLITFDTETRPATCDVSYGDKLCPACTRVNSMEETDDDACQDLVLGWILFCGLLDNKVAADEQEFTSINAFFDFVESKAQRRKILWVVNHNIAFDLMVLAFESSMGTRGWKPTTLILPDPSGPFCMIWKHDEYTIKFVNLANWWGMRPLRSIGETIGEYKEGVDPTESRYRHARPGTAAWRTLSHYCRQDALVVREAVRVWADFCKSHSMGTFSITQAGQSLNAFRHRFMRHDIYLHSDVTVLALERESYMGARTECFGVGEYVGDFHILDVNSLYPSVMRDNLYPTQLKGRLDERQLGHTPRLRLGMLDSVLANPRRCVIARVTCQIATESQRVVPRRHDGRLVYPTGHFRAVLTTRELSLALSRGSIVDVHEMAVYDNGNIFQDYITELYRLRLYYKRAGNLVFTEIIKVFMNSLYGKFGQHNYEWKPTNEVSDITGTVSLWDADTSTAIHYRGLAGHIERRGETKIDAYNSFAAIAAHIIADARVRISLLRETAGYDHVWYCDTDSLFTDNRGLALLEAHGEISDSELGYLKLEKSASWMRITTLKDYQFGDKVKQKGRKAKAKRIPCDATCPPNCRGEHYQQVQFRGIAGAMRAQDPNHAIIGHANRTFNGVYHKGTVGYDGWIQPLHLQEDIPT